MTLITEKCVACRRDAPKVNDQEIAGLHPLVHDWDLLEIDSVKRLDRKFRVSNFALRFRVRVIFAHPSLGFNQNVYSVPF